MPILLTSHLNSTLDSLRVSLPPLRMYSLIISFFMTRKAWGWILTIEQSSCSALVQRCNEGFLEMSMGCGGLRGGLFGSFALVSFLVPALADGAEDSESSRLGVLVSRIALLAERGAAPLAGKAARPPSAATAALRARSACSDSNWAASVIVVMPARRYDCNCAAALRNASS